jgi:hypothetical protein
MWTACQNKLVDSYIVCVYVCMNIILKENFLFQDKEYMDPFPVPLVILGGKYDIFQVCV